MGLYRDDGCILGLYRLYWGIYDKGVEWVYGLGYFGELYKNNGQEHGNCYNGFYRGYIGIVENKMETAIMGYILRLYRDNGKENGNYFNGLYGGYREVCSILINIARDRKLPLKDCLRAHVGCALF